MTRVVLDASVAAAAFLPEELSETCELFLQDVAEAIVPDTFFAEVANVLWKRWVRGEIDEEGAATGLEWLDELAAEVVETRPFLGAAFTLAQSLGDAVHDCLYLTIADAYGIPLVTADRRLHAKALEAGLGDSVLWIEEAAR